MKPTDESGVRRWVFGLRVLVGASLAVLAAGTASYANYSEAAGSAFRSLTLWSLGIALLAHAVSLWWLLTLDERKGMALALGWAPIALTMSVMSLPDIHHRYVEKEVGPLGLAVAVLFPVLQVAIILAAAQLHGLLPRGPGQSSGLGKGFLRALGFVALMVVAAVFNMPSMHWGQGERQRRALGTLRRIAACAGEYARAHPGEGFPDQLALLGPAGLDCLGPRAASGEKDGYRFTFTGGPVGPAGRREFTVLAAPVARPFLMMSFRLDQTGQIRYAYDREPTSEDPLVPPRR